MKVRDKMTKNIVSVTPDAAIVQVAQLMQKHNVGVIPVVEQGNLVGIVTDRDIVLRNIASGKDPKTTPVSSVMTTQVVAVTPDTDVNEVAYKMAENKVRRIPVVENNKLVGILSIGDIAADEKFDMEASKALSEISKPAKPEQVKEL
ncbi:MAG TPA: CBS domain-containing protein [Clostridiaceae bacterium]|nr:CBS domain-containing protein [Clostridiaceae bacterium]